MTNQRRYGFAALPLERRQELGTKGGKQTKLRKLAEDPFYYSKIGMKGGERLKALYGPDYFSRIGRLKKKPRKEEA